jgi:hypothetical protein
VAPNKNQASAPKNGRATTSAHHQYLDPVRSGSERDTDTSAAVVNAIHATATPVKATS